MPGTFQSTHHRVVGAGVFALALAVSACVGGPTSPGAVSRTAPTPLQPFAGPGPALHAIARPSGLYRAGTRHVAFLDTGLGLNGQPIVLGSTPSQPSVDRGGAFGYRAGGYLPFVSDAFGGSSLFLANLNGGSVYQVPGLPRDAYGSTLSGGGRFVTFVSNGQLETLDLATQLIATYPQLAGGFEPGYGLSADAFGDVSYVDRQGEVHVFDPRNGQDYIVPAASRGLNNLRGLSLSGDGRYLGFGAGDSLYLTNLGTGTQYTVPFVSGLSGVNPYDFRFSSNGDQLLYNQNGQARLLDLRTGFTDNLALLNNGGSPITDAAFLDAGNGNIAFTRGGRLEVYNRGSGLIDTLPILNSALGFANYGPFNYGAFY